MGLGIALKGTLPSRTIENPLALPRLVQLMTIGNLNTTLQLLAVLLIWAMIRRGCLFNILPR